MAYTLAQFITNAEAGNPIKVTVAQGHAAAVLEIGGRSIILSEAYNTKVVDGNKNIDPITTTAEDIRTKDLGELFTASQVLASASLRQAISDGTVVAEAGTVDLSSIPTV